MSSSSEEKVLSHFGYKQELHRAYGVWQLTAFGLNYMIPIAPAIIFGFILQASGGTVALPYLIAFIGMLATGFGYAYFIRHYPLAGSLYAYVSQTFGWKAGFIGGWSILLDYILIPTLTAMSASYFINNLMPEVPYEVILIVFISSTGLLNLIGSKPLASFGLYLLILGEIVIFVGFGVWAYAVYVHHIGTGHLISSEPFHFTNLNALTSAASIAMLSYLGFDAITTLAEESKAPRKDIPRAIFLSLLIGSLTMFLTGYIGMLVIPDWQAHITNQNWLNTTLFFVTQTTGGQPMVLFYTIGFVIAMGVFNVVATASASRILFGMSRDHTIPASFLSHVGNKTHVPTFSIMIIVFIQLVVGSLFGLNNITQVVNFGALFGFVLLNAAVFRHLFKNRLHKNWRSMILLIPIAGTTLNFWLLIHLNTIALFFGVLWLCVGGALCILTRKKINVTRTL